jgi:uracil-DNA glycosylase family 4
MSYSRAHLAELGLTLWRARSASDVSPSLEYEPIAVPQAIPQAGGEAKASAGMGSRSRVKMPPRPMAIDQPVGSAGQRKQDADEQGQRVARIMRMDWNDLEACVRGESRPPATKAVFGVGDRKAKLFVVGEAPGVDEDLQGAPFVGVAGELLDQMLRSIGLSRSSGVYITNICKFRQPSTRGARPGEMDQDLPYLHRQIQLVQPNLILALGRTAAQSLLQSEDPIGRMRGRSLQFEAEDLSLIVSYHPTYLVGNPREKSKVWQDLKRVRSLLENHS